MIIQDRHDRDTATGPRWTFGTQGVNGNFAGAYPDGTVNLHSWETRPDGGQTLVIVKRKCRSYRRAVRVLRWHLMGFRV